MTATYEKLDVCFSYPENWTIADEQAEGWPRTVTVQSPRTAFWSLHVYPTPMSAMELSAEVVQTMREEYPDLEVESVRTELSGWDVLGFDMAFQCLDLLVRARVVGIQHGERTFLLLYQAEDQEYEEMEPVFLAMTASLLRFSQQAE